VAKLDALLACYLPSGISKYFDYRYCDSARESLGQTDIDTKEQQATR
jgi:hypothetical protein